MLHYLIKYTSRMKFWIMEYRNKNGTLLESWFEHDEDDVLRRIDREMANYECRDYSCDCSNNINSCNAVLCYTSYPVQSDFIKEMSGMKIVYTDLTEPCHELHVRVVGIDTKRTIIQEKEGSESNDEIHIEI